MSIPVKKKEAAASKFKLSQQELQNAFTNILN